MYASSDSSSGVDAWSALSSDSMVEGRGSVASGFSPVYDQGLGGSHERGGDNVYDDQGSVHEQALSFYEAAPSEYMPWAPLDRRLKYAVTTEAPNIDDNLRLIGYH